MQVRQTTATPPPERPRSVHSAELDAELVPGRLRVALLIAGLLHGGLLLWAYLLPTPPLKRKAPPVVMDILTVKKPPPEPPKPPPPPEVKPPEPQKPEAKDRPAPRPLPSELRPVERPDRSDAKDPQNPAIVVPRQPDGPPPPDGPRKGPIDLFQKGYTGITGAGGTTAPVPKGPDRLLKDERLEEKKEAEFHLVPERGGGFKFEGKRFTGHISPEGVLTFDDRFPIGVEKGGTFNFDLTDLVMKGGKQDPNAAEKRRFREFTEPLRRQLREKKAAGQRDDALNTLAGELDELWNSGRPAAVRRRELFEKWCEYMDDRDASGAAAAKARRLIEEYVRKHLPPGSPQAYTDEELRRFATQRAGQTPFAPYRGLTPPPPAD